MAQCMGCLLCSVAEIFILEAASFQRRGISIHMQSGRLLCNLANFSFKFRLVLYMASNLFLVVEMQWPSHRREKKIITLRF